MIDHDRALELAAAALDFSLADADREALREHLDACPACRAFDERMRADARRIADLSTHDAPDGLRARILAATATQVASDEAAAIEEHATGPRALPSIPSRLHRRVAVFAAAAVVVALIGGTFVWSSSPKGGPDTAAASPSAAASSRPGASSPPGAPGTPAASETWTPVADLTADDEQGGVVALASGFRLASLDGTPAADLAARLRAEPPIAFAVTADADGRSARITPSEPLSAGTVYRFTLTGADGRTLDSWAFQAHAPVEVVETLPANTATGVPTNTGIEVTFNQDGIVDPSSHVTISPKVNGRFEQHGRTLVFVPAKRLATSTIYTVTVSRGVEVKETGEFLETDVRFRFETAKAKGAVQTTFGFPDDVFDSATADRATITVWTFQDWDGEGSRPVPPKTARIEVHRLADLDAAVAAFRKVRASPRWARQAPTDLVTTKGLPRVAAFVATLRSADGFSWFQLPKRLPAGWYVITLPTKIRTIQAILQVTDIAGYLAVSETKTLIWANDLSSRGPVEGATVAVDAVDLGRTDGDGLRIADTPPALLGSMDVECAEQCYPVITIRAGTRAAFLPANGRRQPQPDFFYDGYGGGTANVRYWTTFDTDRTLYRRTDTVNAWGVVRDRDSGEVPAAVTIRLLSSTDSTSSGTSAPLSATEVRPDAIGAYSGSIALDDIPEGDYTLVASVGDEAVGYSSIRIDRILKPAYRIEVVTGRRIYFQGDQIKVTATATFYEGSPVPGVPLRSDGFIERSFKTDATGTATLRTTATFDTRYQHYGPDIRAIYVNPARAEEGEISGAGREIVVFPSTWTINAETQVQGGQVRVNGSVHAVDRDRLEREIAAGASVWGLDPAGAAIADKTVTATFTEIIPYRIKTGTRYDFIEKTVVPVYQYRTNERSAGTIRVKTRNDGSFAVAVAASTAGHSYRVRLSMTDPDKHASRWIGWASAPGQENQNDPGPSLGLTSDPSSGGDTFGIGEPIDVSMKDPGLPTSKADRYLFYTAQRGLRDVEVQTSARFRTTFPAWAPPGMWISGVRFTGSGYTESPTFTARFRVEDRGLTIGLSTNAARFTPGAEVTLTVQTRSGDGQPVPATVVLRGVDEKLFTIGGAQAADPLHELYADVGSGIVATYRSHHEPGDLNLGDRGDTGGGDGDDGGRQDFRDVVLFKAVQTGGDGRAIVTFKVADDLTSWRVSASAFADGLQAGEATIQIPVGLPFFVDATIAPEYLVTDRPAIGLRAYGTDLAVGASVTFAVDSDSLGIHVKNLSAKSFATRTVPLPKLTVGSHKVTITATTGSGATARRDVMTRTFTVVPSRLSRTRATYLEITSGTPLEGGDGRVELIVSDAGVSRYIPLLLGLTDSASGRLEPTLAAALASSLATERFDLADAVPAAAFDGATYQVDNGGLAILPYSSSDVEVSALAALVAPDRFDRGGLEAYLSVIASNPKETRERRMIALSGLAGLHAPVLPRIRAAAADPDLTIRERLMLGLGAAALGDAATARSIGASLESQYAEVTAVHARLRVGDTPADITEGTALMAMLAATNGDPLAGRFWSYVEDDPGTEAPYALHAVGFVTRLLERGVPRPASFAYTIAGKREVVELDAGQTFSVSLSPTQFAALTIEPVTGQVGVTTSWQETVKPSAFAKDPDIAITRRMTPGGSIGSATLVKVDLTVTLGSKAPKGCHLVTDILPSGLVPVGNLQGWVDMNGDPTGSTNVEYPLAQIGQSVTFCAAKSPKTGVVHLRYYARVVTTGAYAWEPSIVESRTSTGRAALTKASVVTIR